MAPEHDQARLIGPSVFEIFNRAIMQPAAVYVRVKVNAEGVCIRLQLQGGTLRADEIRFYKLE